MKKLIGLATLAFFLAAGSVMMLTVHPQPAMACQSGSSNC